MRKGIVIAGVIIVLLGVLGLAGLTYVQTTRFNANVRINNKKVGGLTAEQALHELQTTEFKNKIYIGGKVIYDGKDTKAGFSDQDLPRVQMLLRQQRTFFPASKAVQYSLTPSQVNSNRVQTLKHELEDKLQILNRSLQAPTDAEARLDHGKIVVSKGKVGGQYDITGLLKEYEKQESQSEIHLQPLYKQPIQSDDPVIKQEKNKLVKLAQRTVDYKVQDKVYAFRGSEIIKQAIETNKMNVQMELDPGAIKRKLDEINQTQSTLHKNYTFKTHAGAVITVKGQSYGWALNVDDESKRIQEAFKKGTSTILAYNVYGIGWNINGVGYHTAGNHGIGETYVEVSLEDQRIWVYKDSQLIVTTGVVTGTHIYHEDTPKGVWYIEYKQSPSILKGSEVGNPNYSVKVKYWAPFTLSGDGFHDASWRKNWSSDAYIKYGSGGCVNTPPDVMKTVFDNVSQYEPVVIY